MQIVLANPRGFCAGVDRAIEIVDQAIETPVYLEKDIHHKIIYWLSGGNKASVIKSVINGKGGYVDYTKLKTVMD